MNYFSYMSLAAACVFSVGIAQATPRNLGPPAGPLVLDLAGQALPSDYQQYTTSFTASAATSVVTFAFRNDSAYMFFDDARVVSSAAPLTNLLVNGGFEDDIWTGDTPHGWTAFAQRNIDFSGNVDNAVYETATSSVGSFEGDNYWFENSARGYSGLSQTISTTVGETYTISFELAQSADAAFTTFNQTNVIGQGYGSAIDAVVYAGDSAPSTTAQQPVPEPASFAVLALALGGLTAARKRRRRATA